MTKHFEMCKAIPTATVSDSKQPSQNQSQTRKSKTEKQIQSMAKNQEIQKLNKPDWKSHIPVHLGRKGAVKESKPVLGK